MMVLYRFLAFSFVFLVYGFAIAISGYDRLYNPFNGRTIDILYDDHIPQAHLSTSDMEKAHLATVEKLLDPGERRFLQMLRILNKQPKGSTALIWEQGINTDANSEFIGHSHRLIKNQFKNIRYVASDISRDAYEALVYCSQRRGRRVSQCIYGCSLDNPLPLSSEKKNSIVHHSGVKAWHEYKKFYAKTITSLKKHFAKRKYCTFADFENNDIFDSLADSEMLSHLLAASEKHVIVFAGGWHSHNIVNFLKKRLNCSLTYSTHPQGRQVAISALERIAKPQTISTKN